MAERRRVAPSRYTVRIEALATQSGASSTEISSTAPSPFVPVISGGFFGHLGIGFRVDVLPVLILGQDALIGNEIGIRGFTAR